VAPSLYPHLHPRRRSATLQERVEQPPNTLRALPGRQNPGPLSRDRGGSTFVQMVELVRRRSNRRARVEALRRALADGR
jgi:hypothetical protein